MDNNGIMSVYKESGWTSHDVIAVVRKLTRLKCGHTGTLDPQAEGVLPICLGKATKLADRVGGGEKEYIAELIFGAETDTQDATGAVLYEKPLVTPRDALINIIHAFVGEIEQIPPMYSAVKVDGKKLYELARSGKTIERKPRLVTIHGIEILDMDYPRSARLRVCCSRGTYIRTLCRDIGALAGAAAHMGNLLRTRSGGFALEQCHKLDTIREYAAAGRLGELVTPIGEALSALPRIIASREADKLLLNGGRVPFGMLLAEPPGSGEAVVYGEDGSLYGIYCVDGGYLKPTTYLGITKQ